jgi:YHS domain-containing protein
MTRDPVCGICGMQIDARTAVAKSNHNGREYQFCSQDCEQQFDEHPERYTQQQTRSRSA